MGAVPFCASSRRRICLSQSPDTGAKAISIPWQQVPIDKDSLRVLATRSDLKGLLQAGSFLLLLCFTAAASFYSWSHLPLWVFVLVLFVHGTFSCFLHNGFHELVHGTVFKTKALNTAFRFVYGFLSWNSHVYFKASHVRHHLSTLHPAGDREVVLPIRLHLRNFLLAGFVDIVGFSTVMRDTARLCIGRLRGEWETALFPESERDDRRRLFRWARILLVGHAAIVAVSLASGIWLLAVVTTFARFYGWWLQWLCNNTQHIGLQDNVDDFRLCCRTIRLNPFLQFMYFHMNYHIEHHMYAAVPCYNLGKLRREIRSQMPDAPRGLIPAWTEIIRILRIQRRDPLYQHENVFPRSARGEEKRA